MEGGVQAKTWMGICYTKMGRFYTKLAVGIGCCFALIGAITAVGWCMEAYSKSNEGSCLVQTSDTCPWKHVFSDISNRLQLLEMAFKEQVIAREIMEKEVLNQSDVNSMLVQKLSAILRKLDSLDSQYRVMRESILLMEYRIQADELMGVGMVIVVIFELLLILVPQHYLAAWYLRPITTRASKPPQGEQDQKSITVCSNGTSNVVSNNNTQTKNGVLSFSPKHGPPLRNELCIVVLNKDNGLLVHSITDSLLRSIEGVKVTMKPNLLIQGQDDIKCLPRVKLFMIFVDCDKGGTPSLLGPGSGSPASSSRPSAAGVDLTVSAIRYVQSIGGQLIITFTNDEGSRRLTANAMYNSCLKPVHSHEILRDFAAKGRLFTMYREMTSHQISHVRKLIMTLLSFRTGLMQPRDER